MEVTIGREEQTRRLSVTRDGKVQLTGNPGSVPMDISRSHVALESKGNGYWEIRNLNEQNTTYVNGISVEKKKIKEGDRIELGKSHFMLSWEIIKGPKQVTVDIRHLQQVWNDYKAAIDEIDERQKNTGVLSSVPMAISMMGALLSIVLRDSPYAPILWAITGIALMTMLYSLYRRKNDTTKKDKEDLNKQMYKLYTCPKCGHFFGLQDYDLLIQEHDQCSKCKAKFIK